MLLLLWQQATNTLQSMHAIAALIVETPRAVCLSSAL
jgi:hypothetical protein